MSRNSLPGASEDFCSSFPIRRIWVTILPQFRFAAQTNGTRRRSFCSATRARTRSSSLRSRSRPRSRSSWLTTRSPPSTRRTPDSKSRAGSKSCLQTITIIQASFFSENQQFIIVNPQTLALKLKILGCWKFLAHSEQNRKIFNMGYLRYVPLLLHVCMFISRWPLSRDVMQVAHSLVNNVFCWLQRRLIIQRLKNVGDQFERGVRDI